MLWNSQDDKVVFMGNMVRTVKIIEEDFGAKQAKFAGMAETVDLLIRLARLMVN